MRVPTALAVVALLVASCAAPLPSPSASSTVAPTSPPSAIPSRPTDAFALVVVRQGELGGRGLYTEGAYAFVELRTPDGGVAASVRTERYGQEQELLRATLPPGEYRLVTFVRPCEAACPAMDAPIDGCEWPFVVDGSAPLILTIRRSVGEPCEVEST